MADWIYDLPINTLAIWVAVIFVGYCWIGGLLLRPFVRARQGGNDIVGHVLSSFGIFLQLAAAPHRCCGLPELQPCRGQHSQSNLLAGNAV